MGGVPLDLPRACEHCGLGFPSEADLFAHLRGSHCAAAAVTSTCRATELQARSDLQVAFGSARVVDNCVVLRNGFKLPLVGLGTFTLKGEACKAAVISAVAAGYRLVDTASIYKNEEAVGCALRECQDGHDVGDGPCAVLSKCSPYEMGFERAQAACKATLQRLGRSSVDVYLIHWPAAAKKRKKDASCDHRRTRHETWRALEVLYREKLAGAIGVSNFTAKHILELLEDGVEIVPMLNQIEAHPLFVPRDTIDCCQAHGIAVQAYSPLGGGPYSNTARESGGEANGTRQLLGHPSICAAAAGAARSPAQVLLRWGLQSGCGVVPQSGDPGRIAENSRLFDFSLTAAQVAAVGAIHAEGAARKFCWDPASVH